AGVDAATSPARRRDRHDDVRPVVRLLVSLDPALEQAALERARRVDEEDDAIAGGPGPVGLLRQGRRRSSFRIPFPVACPPRATVTLAPERAPAKGAFSRTFYGGRRAGVNRARRGAGLLARPGAIG